MRPKKRITSVRFNDASQSAILPSTSATSSRATNQATKSANATRTANQTSTPPNATPAANSRLISSLTSPALSSNLSTHLTPGPHVLPLTTLSAKYSANHRSPR